MDGRELRPAAHVRAALGSDGGVLLDLRSGQYVALNVVGVAVWRALCDGTPLEQAAAQLACDFGQAAPRVQADLDAFAARLVAAGLVSSGGRRPSETRRPPPSPPAAAAPLDAQTATPSRAWFPIAWLLVLCVDGLRRVLGFARLHSLLHRLPRHGRRRDVCAARALAALVNRAAELQPGRAACLERSAAALALLRLRGWPAEMVIGVQPRPFVAHAWVELEGRVLNDRDAVRASYMALERC